MEAKPHAFAAEDSADRSSSVDNLFPRAGSLLCSSPISLVYMLQIQSLKYLPLRADKRPVSSEIAATQGSVF